MYSESLLTPHHLKLHGSHEQQPLLEAAELDRVSATLDSIAQVDVEAYEDAKISVAEDIARQVNKTLWFPMYDAGRNDFFDMGLPTSLPPDTITDRQATNCLGYSIVASECLDKAGIEHWLGYGNGHAFTLVPYKNKELYLLDALSPQMNQFLGQALERGNIPQIREQLHAHSRAAVMLDTQVLSANVGGSVDDLALRYPWLKFEKGSSRTLDSGRPVSVGMANERGRYQSQYRVVTSVFPSEQGREKFAEYMRFQYAMASGNTREACASLGNLRGFYPELDARQSHADVRALVGKVCLTDPDKAVELAEDYFTSNFALSQDSRIPEARGDIFRAIARLTRSGRAARMARDAYQEAVELPYSFKEAVVGKFATAQCLLEELAGLAE